jgi:hypothetical protein
MLSVFSTVTDTEGKYIERPNKVQIEKVPYLQYIHQHDCVVLQFIRRRDDHIVFITLI